MKRNRKWKIIVIEIRKSSGNNDSKKHEENPGKPKMAKCCFENKKYENQYDDETPQYWK